jgi:hypothetical protein
MAKMRAQVANCARKSFSVAIAVISSAPVDLFLLNKLQAQQEKAAGLHSLAL